MTIQEHLRELDEQGFTILRGEYSRDLTTRARAAMDALMPPIGSCEKKRQDVRPPFDGEVWPELFCHARTLEMAQAILRSNDLRLRSMALLRSDPEPQNAPTAMWHIDYPFINADYEATPRRYFTQVMQCHSSVPSRGAAMMVVPHSHLRVRATLSQANSEEELRAMWHDPIGKIGIAMDETVEVLPQEGDAIFFDPLLLHAASNNLTKTPRYVSVCSYREVSASADWFAKMDNTIYVERFENSMRDNVPSEYRFLLDF